MPNAAERAYLSIRARILSGAFPPGTPLREEMLAGEIGVSRTPVREALGRLLADGLVESARNQGTFVAALYGMNLKNFIEESDFGFWGVSAWCTVFGSIVAVYGLQKLRKVQRVSMYGHGPGSIVSKSAGGWGLGAWGGGGAKGVRGSEVHDFAGGIGRKGENLAEVVARERALARRLAKAELRADESMNR